MREQESLTSNGFNQGEGRRGKDAHPEPTYTKPTGKGGEIDPIVTIGIGAEEPITGGGEI